MAGRRACGGVSGSLASAGAAAGSAEARETPAAKPDSAALDLGSFGIKADGATDDTSAIQKALDAAGKTGATVVLPAARYLVAGSLKIPPGVGLEGIHNAVVGQGPLTGTVTLPTARRATKATPSL